MNRNAKLPSPPKMPWTSLEAAMIEAEYVTLTSVDRYVIRQTTSDTATVRPGRK